MTAGGAGADKAGAGAATIPLPAVRAEPPDEYGSGSVDSGASTDPGPAPGTSASWLGSAQPGRWWRRSRRGRAFAVGGVAAALAGIAGAVLLGVAVLGGPDGGAGERRAAPGVRATTAPAPAASAARPGAGGVSWPSGANANPPHDLAAWEAWTGRETDVAVVFTVRDSWQKIVADDWPLSGLRPDSYPGRVSVAQPLFSESGNEAACARGDYDGDWATFGRTLVRNGRPDAYVRLGWEFNGNWFWWYPRDTATWRTCYQRAVSAIRSSDPAVRIDWNVSAHRDVMPNGDGVWAAYPGDQYVDIVSVDAYDSYPPSFDQVTFDRQCAQPSGACTVARFAREHGKRFAVPEWGVVRSGGGGGDNPFFVQAMHAFFAANRANLAYEAYFTATDAGNVQSALINPPSNPRAADRYRQLFGATPAG